MRVLTVFALLFITNLVGFGQAVVTTNDTRKPYQTGTYILQLDGSGKLEKINVSGVKTAVTIDLSNVADVQERIPYRTFSSIRAQTLDTTKAPPIVEVVDVLPGKSGKFRLNKSNTTGIDDGYLTLVTANNLRYERDNPMRILTPFEFGAKGDSISDDTSPMNIYINVSGNFVHQMPAAKFRTTATLSRINKGKFVLIGSGYGITEILPSGNSDGLIVTNDANQNHWGTIIMESFTVRSVSTKTNRTGITVQTQHLQRPGYNGRQLSIMSQVVGQEWQTGLKLIDCSRSEITDIYIEGAGRTTMTGMLFTTSANSPSVENNITNFHITNTQTGVHLLGNGFPSMEGYQFTNGNILSANTGFWAENSSYGPPFIRLSGTHIETQGGQAVRTKGIQQMFFTGNLFYVNADPVTGQLPAQGVLFEDALTVKGDLNVKIPYGVPTAVEFTGTGGLIDMDIATEVKSATATAVNIPDTYSDIKMHVSRTYSGSATSTGTDIGGSGAYKVERRLFYQRLGASANKDMVSLNVATGGWEQVSTIKGVVDKQLYVNSSRTIDPSLNNDILLDNGANPVSLTILTANATTGQDLHFQRYAGSTGNVDIQSVDPAGNKMQDENSVLNNTYSLGTTGPERRTTWNYSGTHWFMRDGHKGTITADANGLYRFSHQSGSLSGTPTVAVGAAAGTGATATITAGDNDDMFRLTIVMGSSPVAGTLATITLAKAYERLPIVLYSWASGVVAGGVQFNVDATSNNTIIVYAGASVSGTLKLAIKTGQ